MLKKDKPSRDVLKIKDDKVTEVEITPTKNGPNVTATINKDREGLWLEFEIEN